MPPANPIRCPDCRYQFIGPLPPFCPRCHACLHASTLGTETRTLPAPPPAPSPAFEPRKGPLKCPDCHTTIFGLAPNACPACGGSLAVPATVPRILGVDEASCAPPAPPGLDEAASGLNPLLEQEARFDAPAPPPKAAGRPGRSGAGPVRRFLRAFRQTPWGLLSIGIHMLIFLFLAQMVFMVQPRSDLESIIRLTLLDSEGPEDGPGDGPDEMDQDPGIPEEPEAPAEETPAEVAPPELDTPPAPAPGPAAAEDSGAQVGAGPGIEAGGGGEGPAALSNRQGSGRGDALRRYGGTSRSERAVRLGLQWLARHQHTAGHWSGEFYNELCEGEPCTGEGAPGYDAGHTGLALLCFLGSGHTHRREGLYTGTVRDGVAWLLRGQRPDGLFGPPQSCYMYNHAIALLALAEAYGMTKDGSLREPIQRGLDLLVQAQQGGGGWDYVSYPTGRNDVSVTGWAVMAMKSCGNADVAVPVASWRKARSFIQKMTQADGQVEYEDRGFSGRARWTRRGPGMAAVGLLCNLYFGDRSDASRPRKIAEGLRGHPPGLLELKNEKLHTNYYWYYATLAFFEMGGEDWRWWNGLFRDFVVSLQCEEGCDAGSWDPVDGWMGPYGGRLYATTMNVLSLEVYYRYLPLYRQEGSIRFDRPPREKEDFSDADEAARMAANPAGPSGKRLEAIRALALAPGDAPRAALQACLADPNPVIRWGAIEALGERRDRKTSAALVEALAREKGDLLPSLLKTLGRTGGASCWRAILPYLTHAEGRVRTAARQGLELGTGQALGDQAGPWEAWIAEHG